MASTPGPQSAPDPGTATPGAISWRPLGLSEIYDGAIDSIRANPRSVLGISLGLAGLQAAATTAAVQAVASLPVDDALTLVVQMPLLVLSLLVSLLATGLLTSIVAAGLLGQRLDAGQSWRRLRHRWLPLIGLTLLITIIAIALVAAPFVLGLALLAAGNAAGFLVMLVLLVPAGLAAAYLSVRWVLAPPVLILEGRGVLASMKRSGQLIRRSWWRVFGILLLGYVLVTFVASVLSLPAQLLASIGLVSPDLDQWALPAGTAAATLISGLVTLPFVAAMLTLLYVDIRIRREGLDLDLALAGPAARHSGLDLYRESAP